MAGDKIIIINGYKWRDVTDKTFSECNVYDIRDVIKWEGKIPLSQTDYSN